MAATRNAKITSLKKHRAANHEEGEPEMVQSTTMPD